MHFILQEEFKFTLYICFNFVDIFCIPEYIWLWNFLNSLPMATHCSLVWSSLASSYRYVLPNHMLLQIADILPREQQGIFACCNPIPPLVRQFLPEIHSFILEAREAPLLKVRLSVTDMGTEIILYFVILLGLWKFFVFSQVWSTPRNILVVSNVWNAVDCVFGPCNFSPFTHANYFTLSEIRLGMTLFC